MRNLLILVGSQCQGKSSWIKDNGLQDFTLSLDTLRLMFKHPVSSPYGDVTIDSKCNPDVIRTFHSMIESRMNQGAFTVVDAMHLKSQDYKAYLTLATKYGYRLWYKDFRGKLTLDETIKVNEHRAQNKIPKDVLVEYYESQNDLKVNSKITKIDHLSEIPHSKNLKFFDESMHKSIYYIGDIHGCHDELKEFLDEHYNEDSLYVFTGDYLDRGPDSANVLKTLYELSKNGNITLLEGNHEKWLRLWSTSNEKDIRSKVFNDDTIPQFTRKLGDSQMYTKSEARSFVKFLNVFSSIDFHGTKIFASHGGLTKVDDCHQSYKLFSASDYINGAGNYNDLGLLYKNDPIGCDYVIHGHRNRGDKFIEGRYINLEGSIECGGKLKSVKFSYENNKVEITKIEIESSYNYYNNGKSTVRELRESEHVKETVLKPHLSSFNFTRELFQKASWTKTTIKARGLFVNTRDNSVMARSYNKFFNLEEVPETTYEAIKKMSYPIKCYEKGNGYLGIVSWDKVENKLLVASKSTIFGDFADWFSELLHKSVDIENLSAMIKVNNVSVIFEVILPSKDPHIIEYEDEQLIVLDVIPNEYVFSTWSDESRENAVINMTEKVNSTNVRGKRLEFTANTYDELMAFMYNNKNSDIEGYVCIDSDDKYVKFKTPKYAAIKLFRGYWDLCRKSEGVMAYSRLISELFARGYLFESESVWSIMSRDYAIKVAEFIRLNYDKFDNIISLINKFKSDDKIKIQP